MAKDKRYTKKHLNRYKRKLAAEKKELGSEPAFDTQAHDYEMRRMTKGVKHVG